MTPIQSAYILDNELYGSVEYWNSRYAEISEDNRFEWFKSYHDLSHLIDLHVPKNAEICILGCGNSSLSKDMYDSGFHKITNVDFSHVLIERMSSQHAEKCPEMSWIQADVRQLPFADASFDTAIDKGEPNHGCIDVRQRGCMGESEQPSVTNRDPPQEVIENCKLEVDEVARILKPGGVFIYITFGQPHFRKSHLQRPGLWSLEVTQLGDMFHYYFYLMKKSIHPNP
ncbi:hypothetical protein VP01_1582g2 [Puccinia sorghi]|uniref:Methyltransferase domain-containing protein n=1 Tax=Puccinia sorghi TaxID=27349 RepID=A0A0L6VI74_9BASI|nr:hypothetical protein VP01_1582g2 [Puccinia sorghi]